MNLNKLFLLMLIGIVCSVSVVSAADVGEASVADNLDDVDFEAVHEDVSLKVYNKYSSISPDMIIAGFQDHSLSFGVDENNTDLGDSVICKNTGSIASLFPIDSDYTNNPASSESNNGYHEMGHHSGSWGYMDGGNHKSGSGSGKLF